MKQIIAYVRLSAVERLVERLQEAGAKAIAVTRVQGFGDLVAAGEESFRMRREHYANVGRIEVLCRDEDAVRFMKVIEDIERFGEDGCGKVFLVNIEAAADLHSRLEGEKAV